jgi:flagellar biosynthesis/type III secretory pathway protein FliH
MNIQKYSFIPLGGKSNRETPPAEAVAAEALPPATEDAVPLVEAITDTTEELAALEAPPEPVVPTFSQEELEAHYKKGYEEGQRQALAQVSQHEAMLAQKTQETLESLGINIALLLSQQSGDTSHYGKDLACAALVIAKKITGTSLPEVALQEVEVMVEKTIELLYKEPDIDVVLHPSFVDHITEKMTILLKEKGFKGQLNVIGSELMAETDCRIEWKDGVAESNRQNRIDEITAMLANMK